MKYLNYFEAMSTWRKREIKTRTLFQANAVELSMDETVDYIFKNCKDYIKYPITMIRGFSDTPADASRMTSIFHSEPVRRWARDNSNCYNLIIDNNSNWKGYPKRQKSFMCSLHEGQVGNYYYYVIPHDNSKWGIAPKSDIFQSFKDYKPGIGMDIDSFFDRLNSLYRHFFSSESGFKINKRLNDYNYYKMKQQITELSVILKKTLKKNRNYFNQYSTFFGAEMFVEDLVPYVDNLFDHICDMIDPEKNGFKLLTWKELYKNIDNGKIKAMRTNNECWTDSHCLFIPENEIGDIFDKIQEKTGKELKMPTQHLE